MFLHSTIDWPHGSLPNPRIDLHCIFIVSVCSRSMNAFAISLDRDARKTRSEAGPVGAISRPVHDIAINIGSG